jgi:hypothetical protein
LEADINATTITGNMNSGGGFGGNYWKKELVLDSSMAKHGSISLTSMSMRFGLYGS